jgi:serine/threonine protein kinase
MRVQERQDISRNGNAPIRYPEGSLLDALSKITTTKQQKVAIALGILSVLWPISMRTPSFIEILKEITYFAGRCWSVGDGTFKPVLIDFSLAKKIDPEVMIPGGSNLSSKLVKKDKAAFSMIDTGETTHTPSIGTPTYRAPEVVEQKEYSFPSDMCWCRLAGSVTRKRSGGYQRQERDFTSF